MIVRLAQAVLLLGVFNGVAAADGSNNTPTCLSLADSKLCPGFSRYSIDPDVLQSGTLLPPSSDSLDKHDYKPRTDGPDVPGASKVDDLIHQFLYQTYLPFLTQASMGCDFDKIASPHQSPASVMASLYPRYTTTFVCAAATRESWRRGCRGANQPPAAPSRLVKRDDAGSLSPPQLCSRGCTLHEDALRRISAEWSCESPAATDPTARQSRYYDLLPCAPITATTPSSDRKFKNENFTNDTDLAAAQEPNNEPSVCVHPENNEPSTCGFYPNVVDLCVLCALILSEPTRKLSDDRLDNNTMQTILTGPLAQEGTVAHRGALLQCCADAPCPSIAQAAFEGRARAQHAQLRHATPRGVVVGVAFVVTLLVGLLGLGTWYLLRRRAAARAESASAAAPAYTEKPEDDGGSVAPSSWFDRLSSLGGRYKDSIYSPSGLRTSTIPSNTAHVENFTLKSVQSHKKSVSISTRELGGADDGHGGHSPDSPVFDARFAG